MRIAIIAIVLCLFPACLPAQEEAPPDAQMNAQMNDASFDLGDAPNILIPPDEGEVHQCVPDRYYNHLPILCSAIGCGSAPSCSTTTWTPCTERLCWCPQDGGTVRACRQW